MRGLIQTNYPLLDVKGSLYQRIKRDRGRREGNRPGADYLLSQGEESEEDQLASLVLQCLWTDSPAEHLRPSGRWHKTWP